MHDHISGPFNTDEKLPNLLSPVKHLDSVPEPQREPQVQNKGVPAISVDEKYNDQKQNGDGRLEIYLLAWPLADMAVGIALVRDEGRYILTDIHIIGRMIQKASSTIDGIILARGLEGIGEIMLTKEKGKRFKKRKMTLYTDYAPIHDDHQIQRWQLYGSPSPPSPEGDRLNKALANWTTPKGIVEIHVARTRQGAKDLSWIRQQGLIWIRNKIEHDAIKPDELPIIPMTQEEIKELLKEKQSVDEEKIIQFLADNIAETSIASNIYRKWHLNRRIVKECHEALSHNRILQTTLNNLLCATRFKMVVNNKLVPVRCPRKGCGQRDSWEHFLGCFAVPDISKLHGREKIAALVALCERIQTENPAQPVQFPQIEEQSTGPSQRKKEEKEIMQ